MGSRSIYLMLGSLILGFIGLMGVSFAQLSSIGRTLQHNTGENMLWLVSQTEFEGLRLAHELALQTDGQAEREDMLFRLDMLESRMRILTNAPQIGFIVQAGKEQALSTMWAKFESLRDILQNEGDLVVAQAEIADFSRLAREVSNAVMLSEREVLGSHFDAQRAATDTLLWAAVAIGVTGLVMALGLIRALLHARRMAQALQLHQEGLESTVLARTQELHAVLSNEREAKEIYRSFITTVSHQFRTPLAVINMLSQRISRRSDTFTSAQITQKADNITNAVGRLIGLLDSVTSVAHLDQNTVSLDCQPTDLAELLADAVSHFHDYAGERKVAIFTPEQPLMVACDYALTMQVLDNLLANAAKYSPAGTELIVRLWAQEARCCISVQDFGIGIPPQDQPRIFERFQRASNTENTRGSGLGLNLSRSIARLHGGDISFSSRAGETTFVFWLPLGGLHV